MEDKPLYLKYSSLSILSQPHGLRKNQITSCIYSHYVCLYARMHVCMYVCTVQYCTQKASRFSFPLSSHTLTLEIVYIIYLPWELLLTMRPGVHGIAVNRGPRIQQHPSSLASSPTQAASYLEAVILFPRRPPEFPVIPLVFLLLDH
ncbi:uncharacterized protein BO97DRAFT_230422 [Aspergillus homomorphus CBS 101889]|uniref:Uncharacterized protein n=1 Tax=Aspergillus homomorphus (strain CBS 101889) TaxID=1450537 RepID=A0A395HK69_ASPHC|nr:hypothetical protein BO97DRAFT_230422 [Aspergillus homomorphus CBS 101889]RAL08006.1 hypothetical protein BO97DRAFT_230422 [Aspergillus homomorphus CBS 101889]